LYGVPFGFNGYLLSFNPSVTLLVTLACDTDLGTVLIFANAIGLASDVTFTLDSF